MKLLEQKLTYKTVTLSLHLLSKVWYFCLGSLTLRKVTEFPFVDPNHVPSRKNSVKSGCGRVYFECGFKAPQFQR